MVDTNAIRTLAKRITPTVIARLMNNEVILVKYDEAEFNEKVESNFVTDAIQRPLN